MKRALITGVTGQDGSYLAEFLLEKGYEVHGVVRRASTFNTSRLDHLLARPDLHERFGLHHGDMLEGSRLRTLLGVVDPDEVYHLAAQSHVRVSFDEPEYTADAIALGAVRLLEAVRDHQSRSGKKIRLYNAGSSEMFGSTAPPQSETTLFHPRSPYAVSKVASHWFAVNYRESYGLFVANGILFNHESPRRGETFVTRKITRAVGRIVAGTQQTLTLGNLDAKRDWGFAGDYVEAMWLMLQQEQPDDFVVATGTAHSVRDFLDAAFGRVKLDWTEFVRTDPRYLRPSEVDFLQGDPAKARRVLGWAPRTSFTQLVESMVDSDVELARRENIEGRAIVT